MTTSAAAPTAASPRQWEGRGKRDGALPGGPSGRTGHIEGLDGLRALAILGVLLFHLEATWLPGGFLGVDVFFVVSGFLITTLLVREQRTAGRIELRNFWVRRARRLLPALVVCVTVSVLIARIVSGDLLVHVGRQVLGALTFSTNWVEVAAGSSYFDQTAPQLFMNFWSLAVEEQFYLFWPLVTILLLRFVSPRGRVGVALMVAAVSTLLMAALYTPGADATRVYYGTDTHLMGLMIGAGLAFAWSTPGLAERLRPSNWGLPGRWVVPAGALALLTLALVLDESQAPTFRGGILLASLATAVLVVGVLDRVPGRSTPLQRLTSHPLARWVGVRSYSLYLWHWPVILIVAAEHPSAPGTLSHVLTRIWCVVVTVALADLSYRFVETPFRRHGFRGVAERTGAALLHASRRTRQVVAAATMAAAVLVSLVLWTAPEQSQTAAMLEANAARASAGSAANRPTASGPLRALDAAAGVRAVAVSVGAAVTASALPAPSAPPSANAAVAPQQLPDGEAKASFTMPTGPEIDGYGDSMMVGSVHALDYYFPGIRMDAKSNRRWSDGLAAVTARGDGNRRAVVLAFGTNAGVDVEDAGAIIERLGPDRMVVLVNLMGPFSRIEDDNEKLTAIAAEHSNVLIADWAGAVRDLPEQLQSDRIHPSLKGSHLFAKTVRQAFATLSEQHTGIKVQLKDLPMP